MSFRFFLRCPQINTKLKQLKWNWKLESTLKESENDKLKLKVFYEWQKVVMCCKMWPEISDKYKVLIKIRLIIQYCRFGANKL